MGFFTAQQHSDMFGSSRVVASTASHLQGYKRCISTSKPLLAKALLYKEHGDPQKVVEYVENYRPSRPKEGQVVVKMLCGALSLNDMQSIRGSSPHASAGTDPVVPGYEGVGVVAHPGNSSFQRGDWVVPAKPGFGTWRSEAVCDASSLMKINKDIAPEIAACLPVGPVTAVCLLEDFVTLEQGDVVIVNGGSGIVAQTFVQLCAMRGVKAISVIRDRDLDDQVEIIERSKRDGAYIVVTENELQTPRFRELISDLPAPKLALNGSGGASATNVARLLGENGTLVTYGNASGQPVFIPTSLLLFKNIKMKSFHYERWMEKTSLEERQNLLDRLASLVVQRRLKIWVEAFEMWNYRTAFNEVSLPRDRKLVFNLQDNMA